MDIVKEIKEMLALPNQHAKERGLERIIDVLEYKHGYDLNEENIVESIKLLLTAALQEQDPMLKRKFFRALSTAAACHQGKYLGLRIDWDPLANSLSSLDKWQLQYVIRILVLTAQERYVPILNEYTYHADS
ncbi:MAG: hypothetical protein JO011_07175, partial [Ktedonobacteraceae bacterium]|nr:hypothetical protein [Ktedonobacteraceae bacterium]